MRAPLTGSEYISKSRGSVNPFFTLITPENLVPNDLPFFSNSVVQPLTIPQYGKSQFGEYLLNMNIGACTTRPVEPGLEHFFYVLEGEVSINYEGTDNTLDSGGYIYLPDDKSFNIINNGQFPCRLLWVKKYYERISGLAQPELICSNVKDLELRETPVEGAWSHRLMPFDNPAYDFTMLILLFDPGVYFDQVEIHHQEHGLYMLQGQGVYYLADTFHEVKQDDFIYMAPFCPQFFFSSGWTRTSYLLYKNIHRDGFYYYEQK